MLIVKIFVAAMAIGFGVTLLQKIKAKEKKEDAKTCRAGMDILCGEVIDISLDKDTGFSVVSVRDRDGVTQYGFSKVPARDLESLYAGKGYVQVPVNRRG